MVPEPNKKPGKKAIGPASIKYFHDDMRTEVRLSRSRESGKAVTAQGEKK